MYVHTTVDVAVRLNVVFGLLLRLHMCDLAKIETKTKENVSIISHPKEILVGFGLISILHEL